MARVQRSLVDAVSPLPPRGSPEESLSTYWIDRAIRLVREMADGNASGLVQGGNAASILIRNGAVMATSDYELFEDESMPVGDFEAVLKAWRREIIRVRDAEGPIIPETYRRNPYPD